MYGATMNREQLERLFLGIVLMGDVSKCHCVSADDFSELKHKRIWRAIEQAASDSDPSPGDLMVKVVQILRKFKFYGDVGGASYLGKLITVANGFEDREEVYRQLMDTKPQAEHPADIELEGGPYDGTVLRVMPGACIQLPVELTMRSVGELTSQATQSYRYEFFDGFVEGEGTDDERLVHRMEHLKQEYRYIIIDTKTGHMDGYYKDSDGIFETAKEWAARLGRNGIVIAEIEWPEEVHPIPKELFLPNTWKGIRELQTTG